MADKILKDCFTHYSGGLCRTYDCNCGSGKQTEGGAGGSGGCIGWNPQEDGALIEVPDVPLEQDAVPGINELLNKYYKAMVEGDTDTMGDLVYYLDANEILRAKETSKYLESCPTLEIYTKPGPREGCYLVFAYVELKFADYDKPIPGMNARELPDVFTPGEVEKIYLNFSDPWPKDRHAKRRLPSKEFLARYEQILAAGGVVEFKTDNKELFDFSLEEAKERGWVVTDYTYDLHQDEILNQGNVMTEYEEMVLYVL